MKYSTGPGLFEHPVYILERKYLQCKFSVSKSKKKSPEKS